MPDFHNNGASVHYELIGSGPPLLLIAGIASDNASWGPLIPLLADRFRLIAIDNRGAGRTKVDGPIELTDMVDDCAALLDHLQLDRVDVVGHSMGGMIGLRLAARHPARVARLVTLASGAMSNARRVLFQDMARLGFITPRGDWFRLLYQWLFSDPFFAEEKTVADAAAASAAYPHRQSPADFARQVAAIERAGPFTTQQAIRCPVLSISAALDLLAPQARVDELHKMIGTITRAQVDGAAHSIHWERPNETAALIRDFLR